MDPVRKLVPIIKLIGRFLRSFRDTQNGDRDMSQKVFQIGARGQSSVYAPYMRVG